MWVKPGRRGWRDTLVGNALDAQMWRTKFSFLMPMQDAGHSSKQRWSQRLGQRQASPRGWWPSSIAEMENSRLNERACIIRQECKTVEQFLSELSTHLVSVNTRDYRRLFHYQKVNPPKCKRGWVTIVWCSSAVKSQPWSFTISEGKLITLIRMSHSDKITGNHWNSFMWHSGKGMSRGQGEIP